MNTDKLSTGGASSAKSKKREGENIVWAIQIGLCYCGVGGVGRWGVAVRGGGLCRNISRGRGPSHAVVAGCGAAVEGG